MSVEIVAETGSTHEGKLVWMDALIDMAAEAGADVLKTQWVSSAARLCERRHAPSYLASYLLLQWPREWHELLARHCERAGIKYACSVYLPEDVWAVAPFAAFVKVSSFEATDEKMLSAMRPAERVVVSCGMMTGEEFRAAREWQCQGWGQRRDLLQCVSQYPCAAADLGLRVIQQWSLAGLSDHSRDLRTPIAAVAVGARMLETHVCLDVTPRDNRDFAVSWSPTEFMAYVDNARWAEKALGSGVKARQPAEEPMLAYRVEGG